jgi:arabinose-5-phosphate isomerase
MGDALAIALLEARGFTEQDFALSHPGGRLGRRLLLHVEDIMRKSADIPIVTADTSIQAALVEMSDKGLGMTGVVDNNNVLLGIFTDGDLRRLIDKNLPIQTTSILDAMTADCKTITADVLAAEALKVMETFKINGLIVVNADNQPVGAFNMQDLLKHGAI